MEILLLWNLHPTILIAFFFFYPELIKEKNIFFKKHQINNSRWGSPCPFGACRAGRFNGPQPVGGGRTKPRWALGTYRGCQGAPSQAKKEEDPGPHGAGNAVGGERLRRRWVGRVWMESFFWGWIPVVYKVLDGTRQMMVRDGENGDSPQFSFTPILWGDHLSVGPRCPTPR